MAISFIAATSAEASSLTLPTHADGDLIVMVVAAVPQATITPDASWQIATFRINSASQSSMLVWKIAGSSSEVSGTWTNATHIAASVYRDPTYLVALGGTNGGASGGATGVQFNRIDATTSTSSSSSAMKSGGWVGGTVITVANGSDVADPPTDMTNRVSLAGGSTGQVVMHDTNTGVTNWPITVKTIDTSSAYASYTFEIMLLSKEKAGSGGGNVIVIED